MYQETEYRILEHVYLHPGIHKRELSKKLKLAMTGIDIGIKKLKHILIEEKAGNQLRYYLNYKRKALTIGLTVVEHNRLEKIPYKIRTAITEFLEGLEEKPIIAILFGSYAKGNYTGESDIDIMLVYSKNFDNDKIEKKASHIGGLHYLTISPIYVKYESFRKSFHDDTHQFYKQLKEGKIILIGLEWWRLLESEKA